MKKNIKFLIIALLLIAIPVIGVSAEGTTLISESDITYVGESFCSTGTIVKLLRGLGYVLAVAKIAVPLIIIGFGIFDMVKAVMEGQADTIKKQAIKVGTRIAIGLFIILVPLVIDAIFLGLYKSKKMGAELMQCERIILHPWGVNVTEKDTTEACYIASGEYNWWNYSSYLENKSLNPILVPSVTRKEECVPSSNTEAKSSSISSTVSSSNRYDGTEKTSQETTQTSTNSTTQNTTQSTTQSTSASNQNIDANVEACYHIVREYQYSNETITNDIYAWRTGVNIENDYKDYKYSEKTNNTRTECENLKKYYASK